MTVEVHRAGDRFVTISGGVRSHHSFSFGQHYDPANTSFGPLVAFNDEVLDAGAGFGPHPHRDLEILTWVVEGELHHDDDAGHRGSACRGSAQLLSAGSGVVHSERCEVATRFVQSWVVADSAGGEVRYATTPVGPAALRNRLVTVASGSGGGLVMGCRGAALLAGRLDDSVTVEVPAATYRQVFVVAGTAVVGAETGPVETLGAGDAARVTEPGTLILTAAGQCEVLVWVMEITRS